MSAPPGTPVWLAVVAPSCPAGTPESSPTSTDTGLPDCILWQVEIRIPPGHQGYTGIQVNAAGVPIVPTAKSPYPWFTGDNDELDYPYDREVHADVKLYTFNTGTYVHAWQCRFLYTPVSVLKSSAAIITPKLSAADLARLTS